MVLQAGSVQTMDRILLHQLRFSPPDAGAENLNVADEFHESATTGHEIATPHHETVTRLFREKPATGQPPSRNSRLHESHFTNPPPRKTARPNHQQTRPVHQHDPAAKNCPPAKELPADQRTVSRPKNCQPTKEPSAGQKTAHQPKNHQPAKKLPTRPNRQQHDQTSAQKPPTKSQRTVHRPKNRQPAKEPPAGQRTTRRPSCPISGPCRR